MIQLRLGPKRQFFQWRRWHSIALVLLTPVLLLLLQRWQGQRDLRVLTARLAAQGKTLDVAAFTITASPKSLEFTNRLAKALSGLPRGLSYYSGAVLNIIPGEGDGFRRGSQEPQPVFYDQRHATNTWRDLDDLVRLSGPSLREIRELMKEPPAILGNFCAKNLENNSPPNFINVHRGAQALQTVALDELHNGDTAAALDDLEALLAFAKLDGQEPGVISCMIRAAIMGLSTDLCWDALQADGWTEPQLARLQQACLDPSPMLAQIPRTLELERAKRIYQMNWFRLHSYQAWMNRYTETFRAFGMKEPGAELTPAMRFSRQWVLHPLWSFAEANEEECDFLRCAESDIEISRQAVKSQSYQEWQKQLTASHKLYQPPIAAWRFYLILPYYEEMFDSTGNSAAPKRAYPYTDYSHAWFCATMNLTGHEMLITAIALKRYQLKHGKAPETLSALVPEFLAREPMDYMDGRPLRFKPNQDGSYKLYSVGGDFEDNGGDAVSSGTNAGRLDNSWESRRDWVWPRLATRPAQAAQTVNQTKRGG